MGGTCTSRILPRPNVAPIITDTADITLSWLKQALSETKFGSHIIGFALKTLTATNLHGAQVVDGGGLSGSTILRVELTYDSDRESGWPETIVFKYTNSQTVPAFPFTTRLAQRIAEEDVFRAYYNEGVFFREWKAKLETWGVTTPRCYYSGLQDATYPGKCCMVCCDSRPKIVMQQFMEDLKDYDVGQPFKDPGDRTTEAILSNICKLHSATWGSTELPSFISSK
jgi:hypothetical protein